jgi:chromosome segregation ATPase
MRLEGKFKTKEDLEQKIESHDEERKKYEHLIDTHTKEIDELNKITAELSQGLVVESHENVMERLQGAKDQKIDELQKEKKEFEDEQHNLEKTIKKIEKGLVEDRENQSKLNEIPDSVKGTGQYQKAYETNRSAIEIGEQKLQETQTQLEQVKKKISETNRKISLEQSARY